MTKNEFKRFESFINRFDNYQNFRFSIKPYPNIQVYSIYIDAASVKLTNLISADKIYNMPFKNIQKIEGWVTKNGIAYHFRDFNYINI